jgi:hypothetical protein
MRELRADGLRVPFVFVSCAFEALTTAAQWGAAACVPKHNLAAELNKAVRRAAEHSWAAQRRQKAAVARNRNSPAIAIQVVLWH